MTYYYSKIAFLIFLAWSSENLKPVKSFDKVTCEKKLEAYRSEFGKNKFLINDFELQSLMALSYLPELKDIEIQFVRANIKTTMETRPTSNTALRNHHRCYTVFVDNNTEGQGILLEDVPFNAQIGVLGHEFCHIVDYEKRKAGNIIGLGISYLNEDGKTKLEKQTDMLTIWKGLGWQLYDWSDFVLNKSKASDDYKAFKRRVYLQPNEIEAEIKKNEWYKE